MLLSLLLIAITSPALRVSALESTTRITQPDVAQTIASLLDRPDNRLDYLEAAITFDHLLNHDSDIAATRTTIDRLVDAARQMAGPNPSDSYKLSATRKAIYVAGAWNYDRAFAYDLADPLGQNPDSRRLSTYIRTRKGNCVSMPILFLIVADRIGLNVHLATAPLHLLVRYSDPAGSDHSLEATSGGHETRDAWYRQSVPMSDRAIANGVYLRTLTRRETIAVMAVPVIDHLIEARRYEAAIAVADVILRVNPRDVYTLVKRGSAYGALLQTEFVARYRDPARIPLALRPRYHLLAAANAQAFGTAEALGWQEPADQSLPLR